MSERQFITECRYQGAQKPFETALRYSRAAAIACGEHWVEEARWVGERTGAPMPVEYSVTEVPGAAAPVVEEDDGETLPQKRGPSRTAARRARVLAEFAARGLNVFAGDLPVRDLAEALFLARTTLMDDIVALRREARAQAKAEAAG